MHTNSMYTTWFFNNYFRNIDRYCRLMFSIRAKQRPIPSISASDSSKSQFISISVRFVLALIRRNTLYSFCVPNEPSTSTSITLASSFRTRCFFSSDKRSLSTNNVCIPFSRSRPNLRFLCSTYPIRSFSHRLQTITCNFSELSVSFYPSSVKND